MPTSILESGHTTKKKINKFLALLKFLLERKLTMNKYPPKIN